MINFLLEKLTTNYIVKNLFTSIMLPMRLIQLNILKFFFTSSNLKRYKNKEHYIKHIVAKSLLPKAEEIIRIQKDEFSSHYEHLKQTVSEIPNYKDIYNHINNENKK